LADSRSGEQVVRQNIDAVKQAYAVAAKGDFDEMFDVIDPNIVLRDRPESPDPRTYHGYEGVRQSLESSDDTFEGFELQPEEFIPEGDYVIVVLRMRGTGRGSGVTVEERIAHQWKIRDGKAVALQVYSDPDDAVRDARADR
jgi:hypothetical protein